MLGFNKWRGKDVETGEYVFISRWVFDVKRIKQKCPMSCEKVAKPLECQKHSNSIKGIFEEFVTRANYLIKRVKHKNLVHYVGVACSQDEHYVRIDLAQEFIEGECVRSICNEDRLLNISVIAKEVLESITYLHNKSEGITHGYLKDGSIFLDSNGTCRVADYNLIPYLRYLNGMSDIHTESDLAALGNLIDRLTGTMVKSSSNFVTKCCSGRIVDNSNLLKHPFISNVYQRKRPISTGLSIQNFEIEKKLGQGSFGTVFRAKQNVDKKIYAIKTIFMPEDKRLCKKFSREAELMAKINHKNIVRYITSWKQEVNVSEFRKEYDIDSDDDDSDSSSV